MPFGNGCSITEGCGACGWHSQSNLEEESQEEKEEQKVTDILFSMPQYSVCYTVTVFGWYTSTVLIVGYLYTVLYFIVPGTYSVV